MADSAVLARAREARLALLAAEEEDLRRERLRSQEREASAETGEMWSGQRVVEGKV